MPLATFPAAKSSCGLFILWISQTQWSTITNYILVVWIKLFIYCFHYCILIYFLFLCFLLCILWLDVFCCIPTGGPAVLSSICMYDLKKDSAHKWHHVTSSLFFSLGTTYSRDPPDSGVGAEVAGTSHHAQLLHGIFSNELATPTLSQIC